MSADGRAGPRLVALDPAWDEAAADLWVEAWRATMPALDFAARRPWILARLAKARSEGELVRAAVDADGRPLGFLTLRPSDGHVDQICVARRAWGAGVAGALLADAANLSQSALHLTVNADNVRARAFYAREGFAELGPGPPSPAGLATVRLRRG
jgi:putative acetyltransferase